MRRDGGAPWDTPFLLTHFIFLQHPSWIKEKVVFVRPRNTAATRASRPRECTAAGYIIPGEGAESRRETRPADQDAEVWGQDLLSSSPVQAVVVVFFCCVSVVDFWVLFSVFDRLIFLFIFLLYLLFILFLSFLSSPLSGFLLTFCFLRPLFLSFFAYSFSVLLISSS